MMSTSEHIFRLSPGSDHYFDTEFDFLEAVGKSFQFQSEQCPIYQQFLGCFGEIHFSQDWSSLPFLPIEVFKKHQIRSGSWPEEKIFRSSGTTSSLRSQHLVRSVADYQRHTIRLFEERFGDLCGFEVFALLPNYLEAGDSSLVSMTTGFMRHNSQAESSFYLYDFARLREDLKQAIDQKKRILLIGVTFALLDFADRYTIELPDDAIVLETGGMKGRGEELTRSDLHQFLSLQFRTHQVYSEYGMTELMSQAYSDFEGRFRSAPCMDISVREINDPLTEVSPGKIGIVNIIDLANINTCSFIATSDLGRKHDDGSFEILGRLDQSDIRGCHLLYLE